MARHIATYALREQDAGLAWKFDNWSCPGVRRDEFTLAEMRTFMGAITCPALFVVGSESGAKRGMERLASEFPNGRPLVVEETGHWVHHDAPDLIVELAREHFAAS